MAAKRRRSFSAVASTRAASCPEILTERELTLPAPWQSPPEQPQQQ